MSEQHDLIESTLVTEFISMGYFLWGCMKNVSSMKDLELQITQAYLEFEEIVISPVKELIMGVLT